MTASRMDALLVVALQDLREARGVVVERMPQIVTATRDPATRSVFDELIARSDGELTTFSRILKNPNGEPNLWAGGILDDACRDVASNEAGPVRDVALIGAIRKLLASDIVSLETAMALSLSEDGDTTAAIAEMHRASTAANDRLGLQLQRIAGASAEDNGKSGADLARHAGSVAPGTGSDERR